MTVAELSALLARCKPNDQVRVAVVDFKGFIEEEKISFLEITHCDDVRKASQGRKDVVIETARKIQ